MGVQAEEFDVIVLGLGPGGEEVAGRLAEAGLAVAGVEARLVGGECPYWGCVPSKMMIRAADLLAEARRIRGTAGRAAVIPDWTPVARRVREEATDGWDDTTAAARFTGKGGTLVRGHGRLTGPREVLVDGARLLRARRGVVVATGSQAAVPPIPGLAGTPYWTNHQAVEATEVPESLVVLGGGAVGLELAQVFRRFGAEVTVVEAADRLLPQEEPEAGDLLAKVFAGEGVTVRTGTEISRVDHHGAAFTVMTDTGSHRAERLLVATGRRSDLAALGAGAAGLDESAPALAVDGHMRAADGVWAVGDVTGKGPFTHIAMYQARIALADILGKPGPPAEYHAVPRVTFTDPEVGSVGPTERESREKGLDVRVSTVPLESSARGWIAGAEGFVKLVADGNVLAGATVAGPSGGEVLALLTLAVHERIPVERLRSMIYAYPTFHRAVEDALAGLG
ncbi:pyridine nucleotide-disulfide oxidoreductase [Sphaerisporangium krabiense]|uniref:Pyruvate/2-oxoglutarate dehydrogenase complex dihydrolipoamide dehydrogenase (E3) component n=1 Tax=Sphaerisporangium krabiense TaxID=763782 RepID=A0A7W8Z6S5_9ACTN|nr:NAD(P)/FAD-dependent oxidoreductase [Sphaerisporangium krabiense]MBB5628557.1 pyruvate/2-oxoglutarate dehydrogenase complex dihydrolipoamide dehydrogenase (E3) component [Sphaerisporangium krabiense]GII67198.1 pyridine nucleotide-disulfide oxidoreductase [Sphaerisporangium krabiense]